MGWIAHCSCHVLSTSAKYIAFYDMDCILLEMASRWFKMPSRWVQDGPKMPQDGPKMAPRWPQDGPKMAQDGPRWLQVVAILSQRKAIEGCILSQDNQKYIGKNGLVCIFAPRSLKLPYREPKMPL